MCPCAHCTLWRRWTPRSHCTLEPQAGSRLQSQNKRLCKQYMDEAHLPSSPHPYASGSLWEEKSGMKEKALSPLVVWSPVVRWVLEMNRAPSHGWKPLPASSTRGHGDQSSKSTSADPGRRSTGVWVLPSSTQLLGWVSVCPSWLVNTYGPKESLALPQTSLRTPAPMAEGLTLGTAELQGSAGICSDWWASLPKCNLNQSKNILYMKYPVVDRLVGPP